LRVLSIIGTRPQYIKLAVVNRELVRSGIEHRIVDTGQHYSAAMSDIFLTELDIPKPDVNLSVGVNSASRLHQISEIVGRASTLDGLGHFNHVLVYGDTNTTVGAALACHRHSLGELLVHVEAGLRSGLEAQPEEQNRFMVDHLADLNLAPTATAVSNLRDEGLFDTTSLIGDVMLDLFLSTGGQNLNSAVTSGSHGKVLCTLHRAENLDDPARLRLLMEALNNFDQKIILPMHPRLKLRLEQSELTLPPIVEIVQPLSYRQTQALLAQVSGVITDSGGLSREAAWAGVKCMIVRDVTEFPELLDLGCLLLDPQLEQTDFFEAHFEAPDLRRVHEAFGGGVAAKRLVQALVSLK
jgi:UDP-N-acetylglucosamine 2-epimerase